MKPSSWSLVVLVVTACMLVGCGTVANFTSMKPKVYGGLALDAKYFAEHPPNFQGDYTGVAGPGGLILIGLLLGCVPAEFCCTAVGDTATLPITMLLDPNWPPPREEPHPATETCGFKTPEEVFTNPAAYLKQVHDSMAVFDGPTEPDEDNLPPPR
jgi:hypothetical protein